MLQLHSMAVGCIRRPRHLSAYLMWLMYLATILLLPHQPNRKLDAAKRSGLILSCGSDHETLSHRFKAFAPRGNEA